MKIKISSQFAVDLKQISDDSLSQKVKKVIHDLKEHEYLDSLSYFKKIHGNDHAYKMAIGFYFLILFQTGVSEYVLMRCVSREQVLKFQLN